MTKQTKLLVLCTECAGRYLTFCGGSKVLFFVFFSHVAQSDGSVMAFLRNDKLLHDEF